LLGGSNLAIIGQPGIGKTVALAHLASQLAQRATQIPEMENVFPILLHIADLNLVDRVSNDPLAPIIDAYTKFSPMVIVSQTPGFLRQVFKTRKALILLDGLDELPQADFNSAVEYIDELSKAYPTHRWVVAASDEYLGNLPSLGFLPLTIAAWNSSQFTMFVEHWP
jgi:predicted NACHT family NTPase